MNSSYIVDRDVTVDEEDIPALAATYLMYEIGNCIYTCYASIFTNIFSFPMSIYYIYFDERKLGYGSLYGCLVNLDRILFIRGLWAVLVLLKFQVNSQNLGVQGCARFAKILLSIRYCGVSAR